MLKFISLILIFCIIVFLIFYKKEYILNKLKTKNNLSRLTFNYDGKSKFKEYKLNLNNSDFNNLNNLDNFSNLRKSILRKEMLELFKGSKEEKIKALKIAEFLSDKSILPILKLGLKDMDPDIIKVSAKLIQKFK